MEHQNEIIARVLLLPDASIHIALKNFHTYMATAGAVRDLFSNPFEFIETGFTLLHDSTRETEAKRGNIMDIKGLTLANVYQDKRIVCFFPEFFVTLFKAIESDPSYQLLLNMKDILDTIELQDEKSFLLRYFLEFAYTLRPDISLKRNIFLSHDLQTEIIRETVNTYFSAIPQEGKNKTEVTNSLSSIIATAKEGTHVLAKVPTIKYVTAKEWAELHGLSFAYTMQLIRDNRFASAKLSADKKTYLLDPNERHTDRRRNRKAPGQRRLSANSPYEDVQRVMEYRNYVSEHIRIYIRNNREMSYYFMTHYYHEVYWEEEDIRALIIDINPNYYCARLGKTNRELIMSNASPVVPQRDEFEYHLHHIGQEYDSPLAIIPAFDHNGKEFYSVFHEKSSEKNLHDRAFEVKKMKFWKRYLKEYDKLGQFKGIPYMNHKKDFVKGYPEDLTNGTKEKKRKH